MKLTVFKAPLDSKFGLAFHFISSHGGKADIRNQIKHQHIPEAYVRNIAKVEGAQTRCTQYEFMHIFMVPTICNKSATHLAFMWNDDQCNSILPRDSLTTDNICLWQ